MELPVEDSKREDSWSLGENFLSESGSAVKEPVKIGGGGEKVETPTRF